MHHMLIERLKFWIQEAALRAKFLLYERCPALFPHALDTDEEVETSPEDALQEIRLKHCNLSTLAKKGIQNQAP